MLLLDCTLPSAAENIALDEALLEAVDEADGEEVLRFWELPDLAVIVGRASRVDDEVNRPECARHGVDVIRRCSGGLAVVAGPGCLMYSVILSLNRRPHLQAINEVHREVLGTVNSTLTELGHDVARRGTSDLTCGDLKFSGNSLRCKRNAALYHGTLLYGFPLERIGQFLHMPHRQPDYRQNRPHSEFVTNLAVEIAVFKARLASAWGAVDGYDDWPRRRVEQLVDERYSQVAWNARH